MYGRFHMLYLAIEALSKRGLIRVVPYVCLMISRIINLCYNCKKKLITLT